MYEGAAEKITRIVLAIKNYIETEDLTNEDIIQPLQLFLSFFEQEKLASYQSNELLTGLYCLIQIQKLLSAPLNKAYLDNLESEINYIHHHLEEFPNFNKKPGLLVKCACAFLSVTAIAGGMYLLAYAALPNEENPDSDEYNPILLPFKLMAGLTFSAGGIIGLVATCTNRQNNLLSTLSLLKEKLPQRKSIDDSSEEGYVYAMEV